MCKSCKSFYCLIVWIFQLLQIILLFHRLDFSTLTNHSIVSSLGLFNSCKWCDLLNSLILYSSFSLRIDSNEIPIYLVCLYVTRYIRYCHARHARIAWSSCNSEFDGFLQAHETTTLVHHSDTCTCTVYHVCNGLDEDAFISNEQYSTALNRKHGGQNILI